MLAEGWSWHKYVINNNHILPFQVRNTAVEEQLVDNQHNNKHISFICRELRVISVS